MALKDYSTTPGSNNSASPNGAPEGMAPSGVNDTIRQIMADIRAALYNKGSDIASASTTDLAAATTEGLFHDITGTTTITALGTAAAGVHKAIKFEGALTLTHNATSLILPGGANITTADGDIAWFVSEGSGNWRCLFYVYKGASVFNLSPIVSALTASKPVFTDGSKALTSSGTLGVDQGGTGRTTGTTAYGLIAAGTTATGVQQTLAAGATTEILVGGGAGALPAWTTATGSGAPVRGTSPTITTPNIVGTSTNNSAAAGSVGEYVESVTNGNCGATGTWTDATSISLTAGDWDVTAIVGNNQNGATVGSPWSMGISSTSGNSSSGLTFGSNYVQMTPPTANESPGAAIPSFRVSLSGTTTYYLKHYASFSAGTPTRNVRLSARRVR